MTLNADHYRASLPDIITFTKDKDSKERFNMLSILAIVTNVPIIIVCVYLIELYGPDEKVSNQMERLKKFYKIDEVLGIK